MGAALVLRRSEGPLRVARPCPRPGTEAAKASPRPRRPDRARDLSAYPNVYEAAFSWDRSREARTYLRVAAARLGRPPGSGVELACGSGPIAGLWASWGIDAFGVDRSARAIARARERTRGLVPTRQWVLGDLRTFRLPRRVELAVVPMDALGYLVEEEDLLAFFRTAGRCLARGGILAADLTLHPERGPPLPVRNAWEVSLRPQGNLRVRWHSQGRAWGSPLRQWEVAKITVRVPGRPRRIYWECFPHAAIRAAALGDVSRRAGGLGPMWVYSDAAHRDRSSRLRPVSKLDRALGPRLVCWQRD